MSGDDKVTAKSDQELPVPHYLFAVEPDVEITSDAVDMRLGNPVCAGVLGVGMSKSDVDTRDFFVLQNVANNMRARRVRADGEFPHAVAVLVRAGVGAKFVTQILVLRLQRTDAIIFHFDGKRVGFEIAEAFTKVIAHYAINDEHAVSVHRRSENFASR